jgi:serine/threonine protein kinase
LSSEKHTPGIATVELEQPTQINRALQSGQRLFKRYTLRKIVGRGGMGVIWLATDEKLERPVALKLLPEALFMDAAVRDDLKRETRRSLELTHPNIVRIYDFLEDDEMAAISMEYVDGQTLSQLRVNRTSKVLEPAELEPLLDGICDALCYAHRVAKLVHRDIKPANIMLSAAGLVKVSDFGIACTISNSLRIVITQQLASSGTLAYMSPQQLEGRPPSQLDDIYSLGATLYELLTSKPPFYSGNLTLQIRDTVPPSIAERRKELGISAGDIPARWERAVAACLAKREADRPQDAQECLGLLTSSGSSVTRHVNESSTAGSSGFGLRKLWGDRKRAIGLGIVFCLLAAAVFVRPDLTTLPFVSMRKGGLMIKTSPQGARIKVDGTERGISPTTISDLRATSQNLVIELPGYDPVARTVEVAADQFTDLGTIELRRSSGGIQISTTPEGSAYELADSASKETTDSSQKFTGTTPTSVSGLPTGTYSLRISREGWPDYSTIIQVERNRLVPVKWVHAPGRLEVMSSPAGARVLAGERLIGITPLQAAVSAGDYSLRIELENYQPATVATTVRAGITTSIEPVTLRESPTQLQLSTTPAEADYEIFAAAPGSVAAYNVVPVRSGSTPETLYDLVPGSYVIVLRHGDAKPHVEEVSLELKSTRVINHKFESDGDKPPTKATSSRRKRSNRPQKKPTAWEKIKSSVEKVLKR